MASSSECWLCASPWLFERAHFVSIVTIFHCLFEFRRPFGECVIVFIALRSLHSISIILELVKYGSAAQQNKTSGKGSEGERATSTVNATFGLIKLKLQTRRCYLNSIE